jgi:hypothetical protein
VIWLGAFCVVVLMAALAGGQFEFGGAHRLLRPVIHTSGRQPYLLVCRRGIPRVHGGIDNGQKEADCNNRAP